MSDIYNVKFISSNASPYSCFFYLNEGSVRKIFKNFKNVGLEVRHGENFSRIVYGSFVTGVSELDDNSVGICSKYAWNLNICENDKVLVKSCDVRSLKSVEISPNNEDDYSILQDSKSHLENVILNQIRVVTRNQNFSVKVFGNIFIDLYVEKLDPDILFGQLEQNTELIIMPPREKKQDNNEESNNSIMNIAKDFVNNFRGRGSVKEKNNELKELFYLERNEYRVVPLGELKSDIPFDVRNKFIFVHHLKRKKEAVGPCYFKSYCKVVKAEGKVFFSNYVISLNDSDDDLLYCPRNLLKKFNVSLGSKVSLEESKYIKRRDLKIYKGCFRKKFSWDGIHDIKTNIMNIVNDNIEHNQRINSLIIGNVGSGKTYLIDSVLNDLNDDEIHCVKLECKPLRGKKIETLLKILNEKLSDCCRNQPSVLIIEDLDALTYVNEENEQQFNNLYSNRIGKLITDVIGDYKSHSISVIATAKKLSRLGNLSSIRGPRLFENVEEIPEMKQPDRKTALTSLITLKKITATPEVLDAVAESTSGYNMQDLVDLTEKAILNSSISHRDLNLLQDDFDSALAETIPLSLRGVELHKNIPHKYASIGGMSDAKKILTEVFAWPSRYPELFQSCPLRHQSGVLLYGAPGTGKTLIAGAVANECGLNFISIKGPELLSKYVGASEEGVRNLFVRAQKAQPCVLFFDEFDSLAPRRGHDSTGVTDRVVNQLLTQLDGVEALTGVYVLAATSRPDLLDPALLRPGRLDRTVYCALPNKDDRESILKALSKNLKLNDDVDFGEIAEKSEGFTGADLQAVLYSAQMIPIKQLKTNENLDLLATKELIVTQSDLLQALSETKPSLTSSEKRKYQRIYERFVSSRGSDFSDQTGKQQKVTFA